MHHGMVPALFVGRTMTQYQSLKYVIVIKLSSHHHRLASCNEVQRNDSIFPIVIIRQYSGAVELGRDGSMGRIVCQCQNLSLCNNELVAISGIVALSHQYFINYVPTLVRISHTNQAWTLSGCSFQFHSNLKSSLITSSLSCHTVQCNAHLLML